MTAKTATVAASRAPQAAAVTEDASTPTADIAEPTRTTVTTSSGSGFTAVQVPRVIPKVTFGDGRRPRAATNSPVVSASQPVVMFTPLPVEVVPAPATPGIPLVAGAPAAPVDLSALHGWDSPHPGQPMTSWFGIAGLLLIPLAGAALGYRQARAAKAASTPVIR